eukprot:scaffold175820_cov32-Tisochrysis_lutea.AAC.4
MSRCYGAEALWCSRRAQRRRAGACDLRCQRRCPVWYNVGSWVTSKWRASKLSDGQLLLRCSMPDLRRGLALEADSRAAVARGADPGWRRHGGTRPKVARPRCPTAPRQAPDRTTHRRRPAPVSPLHSRGPSHCGSVSSPLGTAEREGGRERGDVRDKYGRED